MISRLFNLTMHAAVIVAAVMFMFFGFAIVAMAAIYYWNGN